MAEAALQAAAKARSRENDLTRPRGGVIHPSNSGASQPAAPANAEAASTSPAGAASASTHVEQGTGRPAANPQHRENSGETRGSCGSTDPWRSTASSDADGKVSGNDARLRIRSDESESENSDETRGSCGSTDPWRSTVSSDADGKELTDSKRAALDDVPGCFKRRRAALDDVPGCFKRRRTDAGTMDEAPWLVLSSQSDDELVTELALRLACEE